MAQRRRALPTQERAILMRRSLLDATVRLLARDGFGRLTTTAIAAEAHTSGGTVYRYFNDKEEILTELRDEMVQAVKDDLTAAVLRALDLDVAAATRELVATLVGSFERHGAVLSAVVGRLPAGPNANVLPEIEADLHQLASILPRRHRPELPEARLEAVVFLTMGVLASTCLRIALHRPADVDRDDVIDLAAAMLLAGMDDRHAVGS